MSQLDQMTVENREMKAELTRYKDTLAKMEKQWKTAVEAVNESKLNKQIEDLTAQLNAANKQIIVLKKENQTARLKAHMAEDESQIEPKGGAAEVSEQNNTASLAMEKIKELEKNLKLKETELQEKTIEARSKIS
jgi:predicted phage tail protein